VLSPFPQLTAMYLWSLCEVLLLLCLYTASGLAGDRQTLAIRRPHQLPLKKVDRTACVKDQYLGQTPAQKNPWPSKLPLTSEADIVTSQTIAPRKLVRRNTFCRPISSGSVSGANDPTSISRKGSAQIPFPKRGRRLYLLTSLAAVLLLYST